MSRPSIPGYTSPPSEERLVDLWRRPVNDFPVALWPTSALASVDPNPTDWLAIAAHGYAEEEHGGVHCVLVEADDATKALTTTSWAGRELGEVSVWNDGRMDNGLETESNAARVEFFAQVRRPQGASGPVVDIHLPFLWFWDAYPVDSGWSYVDRAGHEQDLIQWTLGDDRWEVRVRSLELRTFLKQYKKSALMQLDVTLKIEGGTFDRVDDTYQNNWCHFSFFAMHETSMGDRPAFSGVMGQYLISGAQTSRLPRWAERDEDHEYPMFVYGVDGATGEVLTHTSDPEQLGTYFDKDDSRLHYLTPVYFKRSVLQPYAAEPGRYTLTRSRLSCLGLWGLDLSINSADLVEVYLGDIGRQLPPAEWGHWRAYNVPPQGVMDEGRFRRDFLGQWATSKDPVRDLQRARQAVVETSTELYGSPLWKPLTGRTRTEFESLMGPLNDDPSSLGGPMLTLTIALIDAIDSKHLKTLLPDHDKGDQSLRLLTRFLDQLGDQDDTISILRNLQNFRSKGGIAHLEGSQRSVTEAALGIADLRPPQAFESVVVQASRCLAQIDKLMRAGSIEPPSEGQQA